MLHGKLIVLAVAVSLILSACAYIPTEEGYRQSVMVWEGRQLRDLMLAWGPPDFFVRFKDGSGALVLYEEKHGISVPSRTKTERVPVHQSGTVLSNSGVPVGSYSGYTYAYRQRTRPGYTIAIECRTHFLVDEANTIVDWGFDGNGCKAVPAEE